MKKSAILASVIFLIILPVVISSLTKEPPTTWQAQSTNGTVTIKGSDTTCTSGICPVYTEVCDANSQADIFDLTFFGIPLTSKRLYLWDTVTIESAENFPNTSNITFFNSNTSQNENKTVTKWQKQNQSIYQWEPTGGQQLNKGISDNNHKSGITIPKNGCKTFRADFYTIFGLNIKYDIGGNLPILDPIINTKDYRVGSATNPFTTDNNNTLTNASVAATSIKFPTTGGGSSLVVVENFNVANGAICGTNNWSQVAAFTCLSVVSNELDFNNDQFAELRRGNKESFDYKYTVRTDQVGGTIIFCVNSDEDVRCHSGLSGAGYTFRIDQDGTAGIYTDGVARNTSGGVIPGATNTFVRVQYNDSNDNRIKLRAWSNITAEPSTWNLLYRPSEAINNGITGKFIGWGSVSAGGTHDGIIDTLKNYTTLPLTANTSDNAQYFRSNQFPASSTIKKLNFSYRGVIGVDSPDFNISCDSGTSWNRNVSNLSGSQEFNCTSPGNNLVWDVRLNGASTALEVNNVSIDLQFNEAPYAEFFGFTDNNFTGSSNLSFRLNVTDLDAQDEVEINVTWFVNETLIGSRNFSLRAVCGGTAGGDIMGMGGCGGQNASKSVNITLQGNPSVLYGNFSGGDLVNVTVTIGDRWSTISRVFNGSNTTGSNTTTANITFPNGTTIISNPSETGMINFSWNASTDLADSQTNIRYNVSFSEDGGATFTSLGSRIGSTNTTLNISGYSYQTDYQVRTIVSVGYNGTTSSTSTSQSFTIGNTTVSVENFVLKPESSIGFNTTTRPHVEVAPGFGINITQVNMSIFHPNGSRFDVERSAKSNGSTNGWSANFSSLVGNGTHKVEVLARSTANTYNSTNFTFTFEDIVKVTPLPVDIPILLNPSESYLFNITIEQNTNATVAYTATTNNFSGFFTNQINQTSFTLIGPRNSTDPFKIPANITALGAVPDDTYTGGFFMINRTLDEKIFKIRFTIGVNPPRGEITLLKTSQVRCDRNIGNCNYVNNNLSTSDTKNFFWIVNNTGAFALSTCEAHFKDFAGGNTTLSGATLSYSSTTIQPNQTATLTLQIQNPALGDYNATVESTCHGTALGFVDSLGKDSVEVPEVAYAVITTGSGTSSPSGEGGAPSGGPPSPPPAVITKPAVTTGGELVCGDNLCQEGETFLSCFKDCGTVESLFARVKTLQVIFGIGAIALVYLLIPKKGKKQQKKEEKR